MTDLATRFTVIERTIVEWLENPGHAVIHDDDEWLFIGPTWETSITSLACAIVQTLERQK